MLKKIPIIILVIILMSLFFSGIYSLNAKAWGDIQKHCQNPCGKEDCNPKLPKCPLCPSPNPVTPYLPDEIRVSIPTTTSIFESINVNVLADQGFVQPIFHPPTLLL